MSENYQSRVFTFVRKRTNQLKDTCTQGLRHLKVAVVWSGQILLYPIHLLAQTTKIFQSQLPSPPQQSVLPPVAEIEIEAALELIVEAGYPIVLAVSGGSLAIEDTHSSQLSQVSSARKALSVMVNENSANIEQYDADTDDWEVSSYSPSGSRQVTTRKPIIRGLSSLLLDRQLVLVTTENEILDILTSSQQQEIRRRIGIDLAMAWYQWHTEKLTDSHSPQQLLAKQQLALAAETGSTQLEIDSARGTLCDQDTSSSNLFKRLQDWLKDLVPQPSEQISSARGSVNDEIESVYQHQFPAASYSFTPQPPRIERLLELPQLPPIIETELVSSQNHSIQSVIVKFQPNWLKQWWSYYREYVYIPAQDDHQVIKELAEFELIPFGQPITTQIRSISEPIRVSEVSNKQQSIAETSGQLAQKISEDIEYQQDWIEADSELIGYSKSPLAKLLAWLDRVLLQIENWLIKTWKMITNLR
jgi:hypothetical protein